MSPTPIAALPNDRILLAPSILAVDFSRLAEQVREADAAGAEMFHVDIMDGHFVPNLSMGPCVVEGLRRVTSKPLDVHLMISEPARYARSFAAAGADHISFHVEADGDVRGTIDTIAGLGCSCGLTLKPATPAAVIEPYVDAVALILVMTVEPGFGGQSFMADMMPKVATIRRWIDERQLPTHLQVDGGVGPRTAAACVAAGANVLVAGNAVFRATEGIAPVLQALRG